MLRAGPSATGMVDQVLLGSSRSVAPTMRRVEEAERDVAARVALRLLVDTYAHHVDRADTDAVAELFAEDGKLVAHFYAGPDGTPPVRTGRAEIRAALVAGLERYLGTTHVVGGQVVEIDGDRAAGETVCLAHHIYERDGARRLLVMAVRYDDTFVRRSGTWRFAERQLRLDWRDDRPVAER
jgi:uncharacterized protein (TIGR02246 family)